MIKINNDMMQFTPQREIENATVRKTPEKVVGESISTSSTKATQKRYLPVDKTLETMQIRLKYSLY